MSRVYFHMIDGDVEILGAERAHAACLVESPGAALLCSHVDKLNLSRHYAEPGMMRVHLSMGEGLIKIGDRSFRGWSALLNTALIMGSDPLCFLAKMHAQCEIHGWVAGEHREWLAKIIEQGLSDGLMRKTMTWRDPRGVPGSSASTGWSELIVALRRTTANPVVMSYSVCEQFPRRGLWGGQPEDMSDDDAYEAFEAMSEDEQWAACMPAIANMQITPDGLRGDRFNEGHTALDVIDALAGQR